MWIGEKKFYNVFFFLRHICPDSAFWQCFMIAEMSFFSTPLQKGRESQRAVFAKSKFAKKSMLIEFFIDVDTWLHT